MRRLCDLLRIYTQRPQEQPESRDDEPEAHQRESGANPSEKRPLRRQVHARIFRRFVHAFGSLRALRLCVTVLLRISRVKFSYSVRKTFSYRFSPVSRSNPNISPKSGKLNNNDLCICMKIL